MTKTILLAGIICSLFTALLLTEDKSLLSSQDQQSLYEEIGSEKVDFVYNNADIEDILKLFAKKINKNIIYSSNVSGKVNLQLRKIPFNEAFQTLMDKMNLLAIRKSQNVIEIIKKSEQEMQRNIYFPQKRFAKDIKVTLDNLLTSDEKLKTIVAADEAINALIVTAYPELSQKISKLFYQLDNKLPNNPQIHIKARLIETQRSKGLTTGAGLANTIAVNGGNVQQVRYVQDMKNFGINQTDGSLNTMNGLIQYPIGAAIDVLAIIDNTRLYGILNMIATNSNSKTISEPAILAENNKNAKIHVGQSLPVKTTLITQTSTAENITYIPEGVDLSVTPVVSPGSSLVSLKVKVNISELVSYQDGNPITTERFAETEVVVETGKTVIIGGLLKEKEILVNSGFPLLKDIPIIGYLFKNHTKTKSTTELMVFLTPEIIYN